MSAIERVSPLADPDYVALSVIARVWEPPPPADLNRWAAENITFGPESPFPGPYDPDKFPFNRRILEVLGPEHPAREVVLKKSAQGGGTVVAMIFVGGTMAVAPCQMLYTHPTDGNASRWFKTKWRPLVRCSAALRRLFATERSRDASATATYQERRDGQGSLIISGANSAAALSMITVSCQVQDDLSKWAMNEAGDPESQADARSKAFLWAKVFKLSTPLLEHSCRITRAFRDSTQEHWHVPCPHCETYQPLEWDNMLAMLDPADPSAAHFTCTACGGVIEHQHKAAMIARGRWVAHNPGAARVGFYLWTAYSPMEPWSAIAEAWLKAKGDPAREQAFLNDVIGEPYRAAGESPPWEGLRDRAETSNLVRGVMPPGALILTIGVDCQGDRVEVHVMGFGEHLQRWTIDYQVIPGHISTAEARAALDALLERTWPDALGNHRRADMLAIDANAYKTDVQDWAARHPQERVICVRGANEDAAPEMVLVRKEQTTPAGKVLRYGRRFWNLGVSTLKASLYKQLAKTDPQERGYCGFPAGMGDDFFLQLCAERRVQVKNRKGFQVWQWEKDPAARNEVLDTTLYAEAAAIRLGWKRLAEAQWAELRRQRETPPPPPQGDLLDPDLSRRPAPPNAPANAVRPSDPAARARAIAERLARLNRG